MLPGIGDSGPQHWQTLWEARNPVFRRVIQRDWDHPVCAEWAIALEQAVAGAGAGAVLVAHSLGALLATHWAAATKLRIKAALLVAVPDPAGPAFPVEAEGFVVTRRPLPFRSIVVASRNDPYARFAWSQACAAAWGSELVDIGDAGHINAASGFGEWPQGQALLRRLIAVA
ncbi:RBBP9/YdeN family alpha/beta hydrolase [Rhodanobacter sp. Si-c]|uniref:RBBP9/YdeN family alpha/beta hydrolase n=1 Tax=Rhodanobacter lycopersici TaxID=3162487 RepID=A0ABV3QDW4_9GAMM